MDVYEHFFSTSTELFIVTDAMGRVHRANPRWKSVLGYGPEEIEGRTFFDFLHPDDVKRTAGAREAYARSDELRSFENRYVHKDGRIVWLKWNGLLDRDRDLYYGTAVDITAEKTERSDLAREKERSTILRKLIESSKDGFGYCAPSGRPVYLNGFLVDELGWNTNQDSILDFVSPATRVRLETEVLPAVFVRGGVWEGEVEYLNVKTGEYVPIWQKTFCSLDEAGHPQHIAFFATDLRAKRLAEAAIFHSSKMASLGQMAAGIAHEVNNPITIIHGTAGILKRAIVSEPLDTAKVTSGLERIEKTALRVSRIIKGLRMFSRSGENDPLLPTPLGDILNDTLDLCGERFRDHAVDLRIGEVPPVLIRCRPTQISQVLLNLLNNSFDAVLPVPERWVEIAFAQVGENVRLSVTDSGPEIAPETRRRLMEPFFTTKEPGKGTGLGLPISRGIIEEHGGKLTFEPMAKTTRFVIQLPCSKVAEPRT